MRLYSCYSRSALPPPPRPRDPASAPPEPAGAGDPALTWASPQIDSVVLAGVMAMDAAGTFRPADPLTRGELYASLIALGKTPREPAEPSKVVTMRELDAQLVGALGLGPAAKRFRVAARDAGLDPTGMLGTETVARLLGLRVNHPLARSTRAAAVRSRPRAPRPPTRSPGRSSSRPDQLDVARRAQPDVRPPRADPAAARGAHPRGRASSATRTSGPARAASAVEPTAPAAVRRRRLRLLRLRLARLQDAAVRGRADARRHAQGPHDLPDERRGEEDRSGSDRMICSRATSSSSARRPPVEAGRDRPQRHLRRQRLVRALVEQRASRCSRCRAGTRPRSRGPGARSPRLGWLLGRVG